MLVFIFKALVEQVYTQTLMMEIIIRYSLIRRGISFHELFTRPAFHALFFPTYAA